MLLEDALKEYLYDCQLRKLSERTLKSLSNNNKRLFRYLASECAVFELEEVKRIHVQAFVNHLADTGHKETIVLIAIKKNVAEKV